jgi:hypothetical protein
MTWWRNLCVGHCKMTNRCNLLQLCFRFKK